MIKSFIVLSALLLIIGCGSSSSGNNGGGDSNNSSGSGNHSTNGSNPEGEGWSGNTNIPPSPYPSNDIYFTIWNLSQGFISGPLAGANVKIYNIENYDFGAGHGSNPVSVNKTTNGTSVSTAGIIPIISTLVSEKAYVVELEGGTDMYVNNDEITLGNSILNNGKIRVVMTGFELKNSGSKVSILSEMVYQIAKDAYTSDNLSSFVAKSDEVSRCFLKNDVNYDGVINTLDVISWIPLNGKEQLNHNYAAYYDAIVDKIHTNLSIHDDVLKIYKTPIFSDKKIYVKDSAAINSTIGKLSFVCGEEYFTDYSVVGTNSAYFKIDNDKNIILIDTPSLLGIYQVEVNMGGAVQANGIVQIEVVNGSVPELSSSNFTNIIPVTIAKGYNLGRAVSIISPSTVTDVHLVGLGAENFDIDINGYITVSNNANIKREDGIYNLQVFASNAGGDSEPAEISIKVYTLPELAPKLKNTNISIYGTETNIGKIVGTINQEVSRFCEVSEFVLNNSTVFDIYPNGNIYTKALLVESSYDIDVYAVSSCGNSSTVKLTLDKKEQILCEISTYFAKGVTATLDNTKVFIADEREGLKIIDVSNPVNPYIVGSLDTFDANGIVLSNDDKIAYIADGQNGLLIIDVSNLSNPTLTGTAATTYAQRVVLSADGNKAYVADVNGGLTIVDISNKTNPYIIGAIDTYSVYDVAVSSDNTKAYIASGFVGLKVLDISNPASPVLIGSLSTTYARGVTISSDNTKVFIADSSGGLKVVDVSNPATPNIIGKASTTNAYRVVLSSNNKKAYIADGYGGLKVVDINDTTNPTITSSVTIQDARDITISKDNSKVFVADSLGGFKIIDVVK